MKIYENDYRTAYEEAKTQYPVWYFDILEMDAIQYALGRQLDKLRAGIIQAVDNNFVYFMDEEAVTAVEKWLGVVYDGARTLDERHAVIAAFFNGTGHIGRREIIAILSHFTNGNIDVKLVGGNIKIIVNRDETEVFSLYDCHLVLDNRIPAHLGLDLNDGIPIIIFNTGGQFVFVDLTISFAVKENAEVLKLPKFGVNSRFRNYGEQSSAFILDGKYILDGSRILDGGFETIFNGMTSRNLTMSAYKFKNIFAFNSSDRYGAGTKNNNNFIHNNITAAGLKSAQSYGFTGKITADSRWKLDGSVTLDGSRDMRQIYFQEDL